MAKKKSSSPRRYWLFKSEADCYSIHDLAQSKDQTTFWDGIRNYQARNMLRDDVQVGDQVFFYHSNSDPLAIAGICEVVQSGYPDHTAFDPDEKHFDAKSRPEAPTWFMVDVRLQQIFPEPVTREQLKNEKSLSTMAVMQKGSRLSVTPVTEAEWQKVCEIAKVKVAS